MRAPSLTALPKCTRTRLFDQTSSTVTPAPVRASFSTRLPPLYAEDTNSR